MSVSELQLVSILRKKLGETEAQELVEYVKQEVKNEFENQSNKLLTEQRAKELFLTKDDKVDMIKWMVALWLTAVALIVTLVKFL